MKKVCGSEVALCSFIFLLIFTSFTWAGARADTIRCINESSDLLINCPIGWQSQPVSSVQNGRLMPGELVTSGYSGMLTYLNDVNPRDYSFVRPESVSFIVPKPGEVRDSFYLQYWNEKERVMQGEA